MKNTETKLKIALGLISLIYLVINSFLPINFSNEFHFSNEETPAFIVDVPAFYWNRPKLREKLIEHSRTLMKKEKVNFIRIIYFENTYWVRKQKYRFGSASLEKLYEDDFLFPFSNMKSSYLGVVYIRSKKTGDTVFFEEFPFW